MAEYSEYKDSGIPWIGRIPSHWDVKPIRSFLSQSKELNADENATLLTLSQYKGVNIRNGNEDSSMSASESLIGYNVVHKGQFVMNIMLAWNGSYGVSDYEGVISPAYAIFNFKDSVCKAFYHYLWRTKSYQDAFKSRSKGIVDSRLRLYPQYFLPFYTSIPPIEEQEAIVEYLDKVTADIDKTIAAKEQIIATLEERRKIIITHAVTHGINPVVPMRNAGIDWLGEIPAHWNIRRLKHLISTPLQYGANEAPDDYNETLPRYIRITDISLDGHLKEDNKVSLNEVKASKYMLSKGDILFARSGATVGKAYLFNEDIRACFAGYLIKAFTNPLINPQFLMAYTQSKVYDNWKNYIFNKATIQNIGAEKYSNLPVPYPSTEEQDRIIDFLKNELKPINYAIAQQMKLIELLRERKNIIINETVTGKVKVI